MPAAGRARPAGRCGDLQRLPVGAERRIETALGALHLAEELARNGGQVALGRRPPSCDAGSEGALGLCEPAAQPLGPGQEVAGHGVQQPLALADLGQGLRRGRGRAFGVAAELGQDGAPEGDRRGDVHQQAGGLAGRRLERLIGSICERALGGIQRRPGPFYVAAREQVECLH